METFIVFSCYCCCLPMYGSHFFIDFLFYNLACSKPVDVQFRSKFPDYRMQASSYNLDGNPWWGRLHYDQNQWTTDSQRPSEFLEIWLPELYQVTSVAMQGGSNCWVKRFSILYRNKNIKWKQYTGKNGGVGNTPPHPTTQHGTARHGTARHGTARHGTARHGTARHGTAQHSTAQHSTTQAQAQHSTTHHTIPYHTIPYHTIPYHTIPYHTIPDQTRPDQTIPYHTIPDQTRLDQTILYHITPHRTISVFQHSLNVCSDFLCRFFLEIGTPSR